MLEFWKTKRQRSFNLRSNNNCYEFHFFFFFLQTTNIDRFLSTNRDRFVTVHSFSPFASFVIKHTYTCLYIRRKVCQSKRVCEQRGILLGGFMSSSGIWRYPPCLASGVSNHKNIQSTCDSSRMQCHRTTDYITI